MPDTIPILWPNEFKVDVQTPYSILRVQADSLGKVTRGILQGDVETETSNEQVQHRLVVVAPAYHSYRHTLIVVRHGIHLPYPAEVRAEVLAKKEKRDSGLPGRPIEVTVYPSANSDEQLVNLVQNALWSQETRAVILSLIAKSNEANHASPSSPQTDLQESDDTPGEVGPSLTE
jgi:hypothetical protein